MGSAGRRLLWLLVVATTVTASCRRISKRSLRDTEGREFVARCDREQRCSLEQTAGPTVSGAETELVLRTPGTLVGVCNVAPASEPKSPSDCRALVCESDQDCPPAHGIKDGHCVNGLCVEPSHSLGTEDAVMLCLAGTGLERESEEQVARYSMALNCGTPCKVPTPCRQP